MGKPDAPQPDARIGEAAMKSAETGESYMNYMKKQAAVTNAWALEDRDRYQEVFQPLQDQYIAKAADWASPVRADARATAAQATVQNQIGLADQQRMRQQASMGVNPASGRYRETEAAAKMKGALAASGAGNLERRAVMVEGEQKEANAINMGSGLAVNPGTSMGISNGASNSGFSGAMQGYQQQGGLLTAQHDAQMNAYNANQQANGQLMSGIGGIMGLAFGSDEDIKENKKPPRRSLLKAVDNMRIDEWDYKEGEGDGGSHVGTYAQDFAKETGKGDGRTINVIDAIGVTMGALKELNAKVDKLGNDKPTKAKKRSVGPSAPKPARRDAEPIETKEPVMM